jgi:hypothetical protein
MTTRVAQVEKQDSLWRLVHWELTDKNIRFPSVGWLNIEREVAAKNCHRSFDGKAQNRRSVRYRPLQIRFGDSDDFVLETFVLGRGFVWFKFDIDLEVRAIPIDVRPLDRHGNAAFGRKDLLQIQLRCFCAVAEAL